jgi:type IV pilus assembly protein PilY1
MTPFTLLKRQFSAWTTVACLALLPTLGHSTPIDVSLPRATIPPNVVTTSNRPMVMLTVSKDHSLFGPIYSDFEDLDDDGVIDTTFKPTFKYYGYFDPTKCYVYSTADGQFNPAANATIVPTAVDGKTLDRYTCSSSVSQWSGNFLNWSTMTRLDVVRKMLYGGSRLIDANGSTVLEGTELTYDAHSFVKYYRGTDIRDYTPFSQAALTKTTGANPNVYAGLSICTTGATDNAVGARPVMRLVKGNVRFWSTVEIELCRWRENYSTGTFGPKLADYYKDDDKGRGGIAHEITIPSKAVDGATYGGSIGPELNVRVKVCDPSWLGQERCQAFPVSSTSNFKPYGLLQEFGYPSSSGGAARAEFGLITGSYDLNHTAGALRKNMSDFGDEINPATGVFCHSAASGCSTTPLADGRTPAPGAIKALDSILLFGRSSKSYGGGNTPSASGEGNLPVWGNPVGEMVVQALQYYAYNGSTPAQTNPGSTSNDTSVGMPVATWKDPLSNTYTGRSNLYGNAMCRPMSILAISPSALSFDGQAATPFTTLPNRSGTLDSYTDIIGSAEGLNGTLRSVGSVSGKGLTTADDQNSCSAKTVGTLSNVNGICPEAPAMGGTYQVAGAALYANTSKVRTITNPPSDLKNVEGALKVKTMAASLTGGSPRIDIPIPGTNPVKYVYITPESVQGGGKVSAPLTFASINSGPTYGTFMVTWNDVLMGGDYDMDITGFLRYDLKTNTATPSGWDIEVTTDIPGVCGGAAGTHGFSIVGVQTSAGANANGRYLTHQHYSSGKLGGMPVTTEYLCGDDAYRAKTDPLGRFPGRYADTVCNVTGGGSTGDNEPGGIPNLPAYCSVKRTPFPVTMTFRMVGETNALIKDPLWYAAKYGYFKSSSKNSDGTYTDLAMPANQAAWDSVKSDGTSGADGVPDGYFLARRPEVLEAQLRRALTDLSGKSNALPVVSSSQLVVATAEKEASLRYDVSFDPNTFDGNLEAFAINADGNFSSSPSWRAGQLLGCRTKGPCSGVTADAGNSRQIITNYGNGASAGTPFRWASLAAGYQTQMTTSSRNVLSVANAQVALSYVRGDQSNESALQLRERGENVLGPIVSSTPWVQTPPAANYFGNAFNGYVNFAKSNKDRSKLLWVGANDGMLHAFTPDKGDEVFAYVPGPLANRLAEIPLQRQTDASVNVITKLGANAFVTGNETKPDGTIWPYVDGSPFTGDVGLGTSSTTSNFSWRTYLFSSLGRGGRGVFALDVTNVGNLQSGESNASSIFKWQFTSDDNTNLGYIANDFPVNASTRQPMPIAKLNNGKFAYLLGNGYKSSNGNASLFILFADGPSGSGSTWVKGTDYIEITADVGPANGLSQVMWQDVDSNGTADVVYAGDLLGNLWKFDLSNTSSAQWAVAYKSGTVNKPLFTAKSGSSGTGTVRLPITTVPQYAYGEFDGPVILFGTGNAFETADYPTTVSQRVFGIWDRPAFKSGGRTLPTDLTTLAGRTLVRQTDGSINLTGSTANVDWAAQDGWYATFPGSSEIMVADPSIRSRTLAFTTIRPPQSGTYCTTRPDSTLYVMDTLSGTAKRAVLGSFTSTTGVVSTSVGGAILDQKVRFVGDKTKAPFKTRETCVAGSPGCVCTGSKCEKPVAATCSSGQTAPRIVGTNTSKTLCFNSNPRKQWREITGLRTDK